MEEREAHALEDVDDFVAHDGERVARAQGYRVCRAREVELLARGLLGLDLFAKLVDLVLGVLLQLVYFNADSLLLVGRHIAEISHEGVDFAFLAQILQAKLLHFVGVLRRERTHFLE